MSGDPRLELSPLEHEGAARAVNLRDRGDVLFLQGHLAACKLYTVACFNRSLPIPFPPSATI